MQVPPRSSLEEQTLPDASLFMDAIASVTSITFNEYDLDAAEIGVPYIGLNQMMTAR